MIDDLTALQVADMTQAVALAIALVFQLVMVVGVIRYKVNWRYTILPGAFLLHVTIFYIADAVRVLPVPSAFFLFWSSLLRVHAIVVVVIMSCVLFEMRKQWIQPLQ